MQQRSGRIDGNLDPKPRAARGDRWLALDVDSACDKKTRAMAGAGFHELPWSRAVRDPLGVGSAASG